jgi:hypothetical protein
MDFFDDNEDFKSFEEIQQMPIYKKGQEIEKIVSQMLELAPDNQEELKHTIDWMMECAYTLCVKVAGAESGDCYDIRMENATLIRKAARELVVNTHSLEMFGYAHIEYFQVLRDAVEEYRLLFIDWVDSFDQQNYFIDRWGLFNPPGVGPHDKDPDDDIPFNPMDFFDDE